MMYESNYLQHHGIKGQKWGVRRFQNEDGSLNAAGQKRYAKLTLKNEKLEKKKSRIRNSFDKEMIKNSSAAARYERKAAKARSKAYKWYRDAEDSYQLERKARKYEAKAAKKMAKANDLSRRLDKVDAMIRRNDRKISKLGVKDQAVGRKYVQNYLDGKY